MANINQINYTKEYDIFSFLENNRRIYRDHVAKLKYDPTFPELFCTSPIVVNSSLQILDGQHRFTAAKELGIGIYYIISNCTEDNIVNRNTNLRPWTMYDYIDHYARKGNPSYKRFVELMEKNKLTFTIIVSILGVLFGKEGKTFNDIIKNGEYEDSQVFAYAEEFIQRFNPLLKEVQSLKGMDYVRPIYHRAYISALVMIFLTDMERFDKIMSKFVITNMTFPFCGSREQALTIWDKLYYWKRPKSV